MKEYLKKYMWLLEMIGAAILFALGIVLNFVPSVLLTIVGFIFIFLGLLRIVPLIKTTDDKLMRWLYGVQIGINILAGGTLVYFGIADVDIADTLLDSLFGYIVGGVLYLQAFTFFMGATMRGEQTKWTMFFAHIILITLGTIIIARGGFKYATMGIIIMIICILASLVTAYKGYKDYSNYRNEEYAKGKTKKIKVKKEKTKEAPTAEEINDKIEIHIPESDKPKGKRQDQESL